ncbi:glycosyltransferase [Priestia megaterium]|uniref:glycosyltransferase n=1 Tax=Priestia megaterium TaxID=1404 RepID=UPI001FB4AFBD|nr:glycosyltransferase [Priestia megaterium]
MMNVKVSVVIPVYNAEKYITECIESLLNQTLKQCEFIFVNDGSKDNSLQIIENYRKKDNRVKLINQENQGVSIARNNGLEIALGNT